MNYGQASTKISRSRISSCKWEDMSIPWGTWKLSLMMKVNKCLSLIGRSPPITLDICINLSPYRGVLGTQPKVARYCHLNLYFIQRHLTEAFFQTPVYYILIKPSTVSAQYTTESSIRLAEEWKNIWWIGVKRKCQVVWCMRNATELFIAPDWVDCQTASQCEDCFLPQAEWWSAFTKSDNLCRPALP